MQYAGSFNGGIGRRYRVASHAKGPGRDPAPRRLYGRRRPVNGAILAARFRALVALFLAAVMVAGVTAQAARAQSADLTPVVVTIVKFEEIQNPDPAPDQGGMGDYYARVTIDGKTQDNRDEHIQATSAEPRWQFVQDVPANLSDVEVVIELLDADAGSAAPDDIIDINPDDNQTALSLRLDIATGAWDGPIPDNQGVATGDGDTEHSPYWNFTDGGEAGRVFFDLSSGSTTGDLDGDGLLDGWERWGIDLNPMPGKDLDLPGFGADPAVRDVFVEYDWIAGEAPTQQQVQEVVAALAIAPAGPGGPSAGIQLHVDTGGLTDPAGTEDGVPGGCGNGVDDGNDGTTDLNDPDCLVGQNLGGGNQVPFQIVPSLQSPQYATVMNANFSPDRRRFFRYALAAPAGVEGGNQVGGTCLDGLDNDGDGQIDGLDTNSCFTGGFSGQAWVGFNVILELDRDPQTFLHELGHAMGLEHGGFEDVHCKPNYLSSMNAFYSTTQDIPQVGGGRKISYSSPVRDGVGGRNGAALPALNENNLDETQPLDPSDSLNMVVFVDGAGNFVRSPMDQPVDWNGDGDTIDTGVAVDISANPGSSNFCPNNGRNVIQGFVDWDALTVGPNDEVMPNAGSTPFGTAMSTTIPPITKHRLGQLLHRTDLSISLHDYPDAPVAGETYTYTLRVRNNGPNPADEVVVIDTLPAKLSFVGAHDSCKRDDGTLRIVNGGLRCEIGWMLARDSLDVPVSVKIDPGFVYSDPMNAKYADKACTFHADGQDPVEGNNCIGVGRYVIAVTNLDIPALFASRVPSSLVVGETVTVNVYEKVRSSGPSSPADVDARIYLSDTGLSRSKSVVRTVHKGLQDGLSFYVKSSVTIGCDQAGSARLTLTGYAKPLDQKVSWTKATRTYSIKCVDSSKDPGTGSSRGETGPGSSPAPSASPSPTPTPTPYSPPGTYQPGTGTAGGYGYGY